MNSKFINFVNASKWLPVIGGIVLAAFALKGNLAVGGFGLVFFCGIVIVRMFKSNLRSGK